MIGNRGSARIDSLNGFEVEISKQISVYASNRYRGTLNPYISTLRKEVAKLPELDLSKSSSPGGHVLAQTKGLKTSYISNLMSSRATRVRLYPKTNKDGKWLHSP